MLSPSEVREKADQLHKAARIQWARNHQVRLLIEGHVERPWMPANADAEYRDLYKKSAGAWLDFVCRVKQQGLAIDGFQYGETWERAWQANRMDRRQKPLLAAAVRYGYSFLAVMPGEEAGTCVMRDMSPLHTHAVWEDPWDDYPTFALHRKSEKSWVLFEPEGWHAIEGELHGALVNIESTGVDVGATPVAMIRDSDMSGASSDGLPKSRVLDLLPAYKRITDATFTLQMLERYGSFPQKWLTGGSIGEGTRIGVDSMLEVGDELAKFGTFAQADMGAAVEARKAHIHELYVTAQIPTHYTVDGLSNLSADGITASASGHEDDLNDRRLWMGDGIEDALRLAASMIGDDEAAMDYGAKATWRDSRKVPVSVFADAFLKLTTGPQPLSPDAAMRIIGGMSQREIERATQTLPIATASQPEQPANMRGTLTDGAMSGQEPTGVNGEPGDVLDD